MGRLHHLRQVYRQNIEDNIRYGNVEFVLLNWNSPDGLHDWVQRNLRDYLQSGVLKYLVTHKPRFFQMARCKNVSHKAASGDILVNLDADNIITTRESRRTAECLSDRINEEFNNNPNIAIFDVDNVKDHREQPLTNGGRIAVRRDHYFKLGGYDEQLQASLGFGCEDKDLRWRIKEKFNIKFVPFDGVFGDRLQHKSMLSAKHLSKRIVSGVEFKRYRDEVRRAFARKRERYNSTGDTDLLVANTGEEWGILP